MLQFGFSNVIKKSRLTITGMLHPSDNAIFGDLKTVYRVRETDFLSKNEQKPQKPQTHKTTEYQNVSRRMFHTPKHVLHHETNK